MANGKIVFLRLMILKARIYLKFDVFKSLYYESQLV